MLDWDVHHGNGTQAIFHASTRGPVREPPPVAVLARLRRARGRGSGAGEGFTINLPVPAGSGEDEWLGLVEHVVMPAARAFAPDLVLVSAGFDAHRDDPLAECRLETVSFAHLARHVRALADELGVPCGAVLEGGYDVDALAASVAATMEALAHGGEPRPVEPGDAGAGRGGAGGALLARRQRAEAAL